MFRSLLTSFPSLPFYPSQCRLADTQRHAQAQTGRGKPDLGRGTGGNRANFQILSQAIDGFLATGPPASLSAEEAYRIRLRANETMDFFTGYVSLSKPFVRVSKS